MSCDPAQFPIVKEMMAMYLDTAKTYMNLSMAALALTIVFREKIVAARPGSRVSTLMLASWLLFLLSIGGSAFYQYLGAKVVSVASCLLGYTAWPEGMISALGYIYALMLGSFFGGALLLILTGWKHLPAERG
jgi:hypothetical protein